MKVITCAVLLALFAYTFACEQEHIGKFQEWEICSVTCGQGYQRNIFNETKTRRCLAEIPCPGSQLDELLYGDVSIKAENGNLWTTVNRGYHRKNIEALKKSVDRSSLFTFEKADRDHVYIRSKQNGKYLSRIHRLPKGIDYLEAAKKKPDIYCKFKVIFLGKFVAFQADTGKYFSRVHRGGRNNIEPLKTTIDPYCKFTVEKSGSKTDALLDGEVSIKAENGNLWTTVNREYHGENIEVQKKSVVSRSSLFTFEKADRDHVYIRSKQNGKYLSRIHRLPTGIDYLEAAKKKPDVYCKFKVIFLGKFVVFQADTGKYLSRVYRGGRNNIEPFKTTIDPYCKFTVEKSAAGSFRFCAQVRFNSVTQYCHRGRILPLHLCENTRYKSLTHGCCRIRPRHRAFYYQVYSKRAQKCENGRLYDLK